MNRQRVPNEITREVGKTRRGGGSREPSPPLGLPGRHERPPLDCTLAFLSRLPRPREASRAVEGYSWAGKARALAPPLSESQSRGSLRPQQVVGAQGQPRSAVQQRTGGARQPRPSPAWRRAFLGHTGAQPSPRSRQDEVGGQQGRGGAARGGALRRRRRSDCRLWSGARSGTPRLLLFLCQALRMSGRMSPCLHAHLPSPLCLLFHPLVLPRRPRGIPPSATAARFASHGSSPRPPACTPSNPPSPLRCSRSPRRNPRRAPLAPMPSTFRSPAPTSPLTGPRGRRLRGRRRTPLGRQTLISGMC